MDKKQVILTYGTFDMFHIGHLQLLRRLKDMADVLIVGVSTDEFNEIKGKKTVIPYDQRREIVEAIKYVDMVIPEYTWDQKRLDINTHHVDIFAMGDDWTGRFDDLADICKVHYLPRTEGISTTQIKRSLNNFCSIPKSDILHAIDIIYSLKDDLK